MFEADQRNLTRCRIAELLWGRERVAEEWWPDGWMHGHGRVKRRLANGRAMLKAYRDIAAGRRCRNAPSCSPEDRAESPDTCTRWT